MVRINIGCGVHRRSEGEIGLDVERSVKPDILCDCSKSLPLKSDCADEVYTSHFLEHLPAMGSILREIVRVAKKGAKVTIIVPYWSHYSAMLEGHQHTVPPELFYRMSEVEEDRKTWFPNAATEGRLKLIEVKYTFTGEGLEICRKLGITPEEGAKFLNNIVYEVTIIMECEKP